MRWGSGQYDRRVTIRQPLLMNNESGDAVFVWDTTTAYNLFLTRADGDGSTGTDDIAGLLAAMNAFPWTDVPLWSRVREREGSEQFDGDKISTQQQIEFSFRYTTSITHSSRITWNNENHDVKSIQILGRKETLKVIAERRN